jgi:hypothetical protein
LTIRGNMCKIGITIWFIVGGLEFDRSQ